MRGVNAAVVGVENCPGQAAAQDQAQQGPVSTQPLAADDGLPRAQIRRGSGRVIDSAVAASAPPSLGGTSGEATLSSTLRWPNRLNC